MMNFHTPNTSIVAAVRAAWPKNETEARKAYSLFITHCAGRRIGPTPGMATVFRLAVRLDRGRTVEEAAAREYLYRWSLALRSPIFGVPHTLGM